MRYLILLFLFTSCSGHGREISSDSCHFDEYSSYSFNFTKLEGSCPDKPSVLMSLDDISDCDNQPTFSDMDCSVFLFDECGDFWQSYEVTIEDRDGIYTVVGTYEYNDKECYGKYRIN